MTKFARLTGGGTPGSCLPPCEDTSIPSTPALTANLAALAIENNS